MACYSFFIALHEEVWKHSTFWSMHLSFYKWDHSLMFVLPILKTVFASNIALKQSRKTVYGGKMHFLKYTLLWLLNVFNGWAVDFLTHSCKWQQGIPLYNQLSVWSGSCSASWWTIASKLSTAFQNPHSRANLVKLLIKAERLIRAMIFGDMRNMSLLRMDCAKRL